MAKPRAKPVKRKQLEAVELVSDAWPRFEKFISAVAKAEPQHRLAKTAPPKRPKPKGKF